MNREVHAKYEIAKETVLFLTAKKRTRARASLIFRECDVT